MIQRSYSMISMIKVKKLSIFFFYEKLKLALRISAFVAIFEACQKFRSFAKEDQRILLIMYRNSRNKRVLVTKVIKAYCDKFNFATA